MTDQRDAHGRGAQRARHPAAARGRGGRRVAVAGTSSAPRCSRTCAAAGFTGAIHPVNPQADSDRRPPLPSDGRGDRGARRPGGDRRARGRRARRRARLRARRRARRGGAVRRLRRGRRRRDAPRSASWSSWCAARGCGSSGPNCMGVLNTDPAVSLNATFAPRVPDGRQHRHAVAERRARAGDPRPPAQPEPRALHLRVGGQQGRRLGQRPAVLLGRRPAHARRAALPRELRQPAQVRAPRARGGAREADRRRQVGALGGGHARRAPVTRRRSPASTSASTRCSSRPA